MERAIIFDRYNFNNPDHNHLDTPSHKHYLKRVIRPYKRRLSQAPTTSPLILDLAAGLGKVANNFESGGEYMCVRHDLSFQGLSLATGNCVQALATELPFANNSFAAVHCKDALVHIEDRNTLFAEVNRCLEPGGLVLLTSQYQPMSAMYISVQRRNKQPLTQVEPLPDGIPFETLFELFTTIGIPQECIDPPYYRTMPSEIIELGKNYGFQLVELTSWKPPDAVKDWFKNPAQRFVVTLQKS